MKIKASLIYQVNDSRKSLTLFFIIIAAINVIAIVLTKVVNSGPIHFSLSGMEVSSFIFTFILGLCSFKENYKMLMQNNVSRRSILIGRMGAALITSLITAVLDIILFVLTSLVIGDSESVNHVNMFQKVFSSQADGMNIVLLNILSLLLCFFAYITLFSLGYVISLVFYRLSKAGKALVGAGVPVLFIYVLPIVDTFFFDGTVYYHLFKFISAVLGITSGNYWYMYITCTVVFLLNTGFAWLLIRKAPVKE